MNGFVLAQGYREGEWEAEKGNWEWTNKSKLNVRKSSK